MNIWLLWLLITVIPGLDGMFSFIVFLSGVGFVILGGFSLGFYVEGSKEFHEKKLLIIKMGTILASLSVCASLLTVLTPSKEEITYITGGYIVSNIETIEDLPPNLAKSANKFLEDYLSKEEMK